MTSYIKKLKACQANNLSGLQSALYSVMADIDKEGRPWPIDFHRNLTDTERRTLEKIIEDIERLELDRNFEEAARIAISYKQLLSCARKRQEQSKQQ